MRSCVISILVLICAFFQPVRAQEPDSLVLDPLPADTIRFVPETVTRPLAMDTLLKSSFSPNPTKAVIYSAIFPGLGQIYNRKYWKLPIVYGGFMGCAYAISFNSRFYKDYSNAYLDFTDSDPNTQSYNDFVPYGYVISSSDSAWFAGVLKRKKDFYRRNRDLSYIITVGLYVICMIDAYVDAQLFDFDISPDLSLRVEPAIFERTRYNRRSFGIQCSFSF